MEVTKQEQEELLKWLFGKDVEIKQEEDTTLAPYYDDFNIYYTKDIYNLFQTKPLKREGKILQLGSEILENPNCYHTRLQHSKGSYRNAIQFLTIQYRNPEWRKYIEENRLKGYLVEKIKFMCVHDIGHSMFSHSIEKLIGDQNCTHEDIGRRILKENAEVREALDKIKADEKDSNLEGDGSLESLCEGNIDFDRMDFLIRDRVYTGKEYAYGLILKLNMTCCDLEYVPEQGNYQYVYRQEALPYIEEFLQLRDEMYKKDYRSKQRKMTDCFMSYLLEELSSGRIKNTPKFQYAMENIVGKKLEEIDIEAFLETNDITFLDQLINDINETDKNEALKFITQHKKALFQVAVSLLDPQNTKFSEYNENEQEFIRTLKKLISVPKSQSKETKIKIEDIIANVELEDDKRVEIEEKINLILEDKKADGIYPYKSKFKKYDKNQPIYIKDKNGTIYKLNEFPELDMDLSDEYKYGVEVVIPKLRSQGIPEEKITQIKQVIQEYQEQEQKEKTGKNIDTNRMEMFKGKEKNYQNIMDNLFEEER